MRVPSLYAFNNGDAMADITTPTRDFALMVKERIGYCRGNDRDWVKFCTDDIKGVPDVARVAETLPVTCQKRSVLLELLKHGTGGVEDELAWAKRMLARARRMCCSCHETGSYMSVSRK